MTYFPDLSAYTYLGRQNTGTALNVGWLSKAHAYTTGDLPRRFLERLWSYCGVFVNAMRGFARCELCEQASPWPVAITYLGKSLNLGSAEIRVIGPDHKIYASPNLIFHYIVEHHYLPPPEFVKAVCEGPLPGSDEYAAAIAFYQWKVEHV